MPIERPQLRAADGSGELPLQTYRHFADRGRLTAAVLEQMLADVLTRRLTRTREPVGHSGSTRSARPRTPRRLGVGIVTDVVAFAIAACTLTGGKLVIGNPLGGGGGGGGGSSSTSGGNGGGTTNFGGSSSSSERDQDRSQDTQD